jgi:hypothetical protein
LKLHISPREAKFSPSSPAPFLPAPPVHKLKNSPAKM